jgi:sialate O-acetylesterase
LKADPKFAALLERWETTEATYDHETALANWKEKAAAARAAGKRPPRRPRNPLTGQHRPANLYNGVLKPLIGYGIRGAIWYQGESNAARAYQYRDLFPLMISSWREEWQQGDFPFFWVQLADFRGEVTEPQASEWAELREAQTMTLSLPNTGQAVIVDIGEANDIHPQNKRDVGKRLARWALATIHGFDIAYRSPEYRSMERQGNRVVVTFDHVGGGLEATDVDEVRGFAVAGEDRVFVKAQARITAANQVEVWSDEVADPQAVRYAWADNPIANLSSKELLPVTPFRTDQWPGKTVDAK